MIDKKQLKEDFKNYVPDKGIFAIKNIKSGRVFLGSSLNMHDILKKHKFVLDTGTHRNFKLQEEYTTLGSENFTFEVLEKLIIKDDIGYNYEEDLQILEMLWIDKFRPLEVNCYNSNEKIRTH